MDVMKNFLVEVEDLEGDTNTGALSMFMYINSIPQVMVRDFEAMAGRDAV